MLKIRGKVGQSIITKTIGAFDKIVSDLETGIQHCTAEIENSQKLISAEQATIGELSSHITKAKILKDKVSKLLEA